MTKNRKTYLISVAVCAVLTLALLMLPTGFEGAVKKDNSQRVKAEVLSVDNSNIIDTGLVQSGEQSCQVRILQGDFKGEEHTCVNTLTGSLEQDKIFEPGDMALVMVSQSDGEVKAVSAIDHYRINWEIGLGIAFFAFLVAFAGWTGVRAMLSFVISILMIWKVLVPSCLKGYNAILVGGIVTVALTVLIIMLVYGFDKRSLSAIAGSVAGLIVTCIMGIICTKGFKIHGAVMAYSESLLYSGYQNLDLTQIFMASIFIGSSGAMMDLTVDITSAVYEVVQKRPDLSRKEAVKSGINVGRAAMGTMTTTLLLAYSGGFIALMMVFMAQGTPIINIFNYKYVASELIHTIVGSFGLVTAAPLTALAAGCILGGQKTHLQENEGCAAVPELEALLEEERTE